MTRGRLSGGSALLFYSGTVLLLLIFPFSASPRKHLYAGRVCPCTCVPVHACVLCAGPQRLRLVTLPGGNSRSTSCEQKHVFCCLLCSHQTPPVSTVLLKGDARILLKLLQAPRGPEIKGGDKRELHLNSFGIQFVKWPEAFNSLSPFCSEQHLQSSCSLHGSDGFAYTLIFL